jgi:hypothetical protein
MPRGGARPGAGRKHTYRPELGRKLVELAAAGKSLQAICKLPGMPPAQTVDSWVTSRVDPEFTEAWLRAREQRAHRWFDEVLELSDQAADCKAMHEVQAYRLRVDSRKWAAARLLPSVYGERTQVDHHNAPEVRIYLPDNGRLYAQGDRGEQLVGDLAAGGEKAARNADSQGSRATPLIEGHAETVEDGPDETDAEDPNA